MAALIVLDDRVRDRAWSALERGAGGGLAGAGELIVNLGDALTIAMRSQTLAHAPMLLFVALAGVLVGLMLRT